MGNERTTGKPVDIATQHTLSWLCRELGPSPKRILEVGCGRGEVAAGLAGQGHSVVAIDARADCVEQARSLGVTAFVLEFPQVTPEIGADPFDAVLFARVLHHIERLSVACERTESLLAPGGKVLLEDFAWERVDATTASWFFSLLRVFRALGCVPDDEWNWDAAPLDAWREPFIEHRLHAGEPMLQALRERFSLQAIDGVPYAYRWFADYLEHDNRGADVTESLFHSEAELIGTGMLVPIGLRAVALNSSDRSR